MMVIAGTNDATDLLRDVQYAVPRTELASENTRFLATCDMISFIKSREMDRNAVHLSASNSS